MKVAFLAFLSFVGLIYSMEYACTYKSGNDFYDLSGLSHCDQSGYPVETSDDGTFVLNVCNDVQGCGSGVAVCQDSSFDCGHGSSATFSAYTGPGKGVVLTYANGANSCPGNVARKSVITFVCDQNASPDPSITFTSENPTCAYNFMVKTKQACPTAMAPQKELCLINVFLVPHTHDDVGWLMTVTGYYESQVKHIIDTSVQALVDNPERRFIYVEQSYFTRWWFDTNTTDKQRQDLRNLVKNGRWEFVLGGWVMPDEAATTYGGVIDQLTLGHQFLVNTFGVTPTKGWQIDPFGASSVTPIIYKLAGCDGHIIDRITNKGSYENSRHLDFLWQGSPTLGKKAELFTEIMGGGGYCDFIGTFDFGNDPVNPGNVASYGQKMVDIANSRVGWYQTPNILAEWGCDFAFQNAKPMFHSMDQVVDWLQANVNRTRVNVKYATLSDYFAAVQVDGAKQQVAWPVDSGADFFNYFERLWWTGYFTSRVELKGFVRQGEATSHVAEPILALGRLTESFDVQKAYDQLYTLRVANGNAQHHDGVTGTSVPEVVQMYKDDIIDGMEQALSASSTVLNLLLKSSASSPSPNLMAGSDALLNIDNGQTVALVVFNSLGWSRSEVVSVAVNRPDLTVVDENNAKVVEQTIPELGGNTTGKFYLFFTAQIPPLGYSTYFVMAPSSNPPDVSSSVTIETKVGDDVVLSNSMLSVTISGSTGRMSSITNKKRSLTVDVDQNLLEYTSTHSGAYAFGPAGPAVPVSSAPPTTTLIQGPLFSQVYQVYSPPKSIAKQTVRVYTGNVDVETSVEMLFDLGPLPSHKEIVTRFSTSIGNSGMFSSDANGFQFLERKYDWSGGIEANFYPMVYGSFIRDNVSQLSLVSERSHGTSSVSDGQLEVMLHRNPDMGDGFGPGLTDTTEVFPSLRVIVDRPADSFGPIHKQTYLMNFPVSVFSAPTQSQAVWKSRYATTDQFLKSDFPANVHLQGFSALDASSKKAIFRLTHLFAAREDPVLSQPVTINVSDFLSAFTIKSFVETTLSANKVLVNPSPLTITIAPSEIRTFVVEFA